MTAIEDPLRAAWRTALPYLSGEQVLLQALIIAVALALAAMAAALAAPRLGRFAEGLPPEAFLEVRSVALKARVLLFPLFAALALSVAQNFAAAAVSGDGVLVRTAQGAAIIYLIFGAVGGFIRNGAIRFILKWIAIPLALIYMAGWFDELVTQLDGVALQAGKIKISLYAVLRTAIFAVVLFWLGRISNDTGQKVIRANPGLDGGAKALFAKLFQIGVYTLMLLLLLNVMGVDLTALAVFGGALGVGLGIGLQAIASNFISGVIILLDRSIAIGDYIELEDGRAGVLRDLTIRSAKLETFDGKDIMVPNEKFITTAFTNWTHSHPRQRYAIRFQVAYDTDLPALFDIVREVAASHPQVLNGEAHAADLQPDAEIEKFGESGIDILVEFWMAGIDEGPNRVGADLMLMIWTALKANGIEMPFPQREVRMVRP